MAAVAYLDTHVLIWLHAKRLDLFTPRVRAAPEEAAVRISPMVELELRYLHEDEGIRAHYAAAL